jgi:tetratricopeptide (TPR) repeat protein
VDKYFLSFATILFFMLGGVNGNTQDRVTLTPSPLDAPEFQKIPRLKTYTVRPRDHLYRIAQRYYGNKPSKNFLIALNPGLKNPLTPGQKIKIPVVMDYTVRSGDTLAKIAGHYLERTHRFPFLMATTELPEYPNVEAGTPLKIPYALSLSLQDLGPKIKNLKSLSDLYFIESFAPELILAYNHLPRETSLEEPLEKLMKQIQNPNVLERNQATQTLQIEIPLLAFVAKAGGLQGGYEPRRGSVLLENAIQSYKNGKFRESLELLGRASKAPWNTFIEWSLIHRYQAFSYIALGDIATARSHFRAMLRLDPGASLSSQQTSPKILRVFESL